jgi:hypothetical protein
MGLEPYLTYFSISNGALKCRAGAKAQSFAGFDGTSELVP